MTERERLIELISHVLYMGGLEEKLADYLIENGVTTPPCKVGDTVYDISDFSDGLPFPEMYEWRVCCIEITKSDDETVFSIDGMLYPAAEWGRTLFFSKSEAEKKLKEMRTNDKK